MNKNAKRLLCLALCLMMVLSVLPLTALAADTIRVYCKAPSGWTNCNAYWWGSTTGPNPQWPGEAMKTDRYGIWYIDIPADTPNIIFNNGSTQSADLKVPTNGKMMFVYSSKTWSEYDPEPTPDPEPVVFPYYVAGEAALCGVAWDPAASENGMTDEDKDGIYTKTYTNVATGTYQLKVTDGTWTNSWGQGSGNYVITVEENDVTVEVRFDSNTKQLMVVVNGIEPDVVTGFFVAGTMNEWNAADPAFKMSENANGFYVLSFEVTEGQHSLKVTNGTWDQSWGGDGAEGNYDIKAIADGTVTVVFDPLNYVVMVNGDCLEEINPEALEIYSVHVVGDLTLTGADWNVTANEMVANGSIYTLTLDNIPSGTYEFKFAANGDWLINWGAGVEMTSGETYDAWFNSQGNNIIKITTESASVTFTLDLTNMDPYKGEGGNCSVVINGEGGNVPTPDVPADADYYVAGDFNEWNQADAAYAMVAGENGYYTLTFNVTAGEHAAKVTDGTWDNSWGGLGAGGNYEFVAVTDGSVTVLFDSVNYIVDIFGDCLGEIQQPDFYVAGEFNGWSCNDAAYMMTPGIEGNYIYNLPVIPGTYAVKVTDGTWDNSWGGLGENGNYEFTVIAEGTVTICFDTKTYTLSVIGDCLEETVAADYYVAGDFNGWKENDIAYKMVAGENGIYTLEMELVKGFYGLKVTDGTWTNSWGGLGQGGNYEFTLASDCLVTVTFDSVNKTVAVEGDFEPPVATELEINAVYAVGAAGLTGVEWDPTHNQMFGENGIYTITFSDVAAGTYEMKFAANGAWEISWGTGEELVSGESYAAWFNGGNSKVVVAEDGSEVVLTLDLSAMDTITGEGAVCSATIIPPSAEWGVAVSGTIKTGKKNVTGVTVELWAEGASKATYTTTAVDGTYTINNVAAGTYTVKMSKANYVTRSYQLTVGYENVTLDGQIGLRGDINLDGAVNILDVAKAYAHVKGNKLTDDYAIACADVKGGGSIAITDVAALYAHTKGTTLLF